MAEGDFWRNMCKKNSQPVSAKLADSDYNNNNNNNMLAYKAPICQKT